MNQNIPCVNTMLINKHLAEQEALEAKQGYIDTQVESLLKIEDEVTDAIAHMDDDSVLEILTALQMGKRIKRKSHWHWRVDERSPLAVLDDFVRDHLEKMVKEEME